VGVAVISGSRSYLTGQLQEIDQAANRITQALGAQIIDSYAEFLSD
jgi:hypothetical protein